MTLDRLGVRGKLNLLLVLPLAAVMFVAVPLFVNQVGSAQSAATTAQAARNARQLGILVWELQRERLITAGYLASPNASGVNLLIQQQAVIDAAATVRAELGADASDEIVEALTRVGSLKELRSNALRRSVAVDSLVRTFHAIIESVINALRLTVQRGSDAEGAGQLAALDALLRASEQSTLAAMALVAAATTPQTGLGLLDSASEQFHLFTERFVQQANRQQSALVVLVDQGETARRIDDLVVRLPDVLRDTGGRAAFISEALTVAEAQASLRRMVLDRVTTEIADAAAARASTAELAAWTVGLGTTALFAVVIGLALVISRSIADPLRQLTAAAATTADLANAELTRVADVEGVDEQPPRLATINVASGHEVGQLAAAFNRVQATAAMLLQRQLVSRQNVSRMFANVAQRTQNLVTRQLTVIDELERNEQNARILSGLYQIDHISTRLRRTSENLLVIAGVRDNAKLVGPATLSAILRSAFAEIEEYRRVQFDDSCDVTVAPALVSDLVLVFAELLENATAFSPPQSFVEVHAAHNPDGSCLVRITDHGIGMAPERLSEENRRLVESERLDVTPTSVLGLFVVGRLARRHGLGVALTSTPRGGITATVKIPPVLIAAGSPLTGPDAIRVPALAPPRQSAAPLLALPTPVVIPRAGPADEHFSWFCVEPASRPAHGMMPTTAAVPIAAAAHAPAHQPHQESRGGLKRRVPGAPAVPPDALPPSELAPAAQPARDASSARTVMDDYQSAVARAAVSAAPPPPTDEPTAGGDLVRRVPGENLAPGLRDRPPGAAPPSGHPRAMRDPEAARATFDAYTNGRLRAAASLPVPAHVGAANHLHEGEQG